MVPFLSPTNKFPLKKSTLFGCVSGPDPISISFSSLKLPPFSFEIIATFRSLDPEIILFPSVVIAVTFEA